MWTNNDTQIPAHFIKSPSILKFVPLYLWQKKNLKAATNFLIYHAAIEKTDIKKKHDS